MIADRIILERANIEDATRILEILQLCFRFDVEKNGESLSYRERVEEIKERIQKSIFYKIILDNVIIGSVEIFKKDTSHYHINTICVHPEFQNLGIGKKAIKLVINKHSDIKYWIIDLPLQSSQNRLFFEKLGFKKLEKIVHTENTKLVRYELTINKQVPLF